MKTNTERIFIMDFFEDLKRTATNAADIAVKKTNELTELTKIKINIRSANSKLKEAYAEIGRLFYTSERSGVDFTAEIAENIIKADNLVAEINAYKKKLSALRNLINCEGCGNEIPYTAAFCSFCGMKQEHPEPEAEKSDTLDAEEVIEEILEDVEDIFEDNSDEE